jgi:trigger factor
VPHLEVSDLNIQTEKQENHTARITVDITPERFDEAKRNAARRLSRRISIPGFRKGKAPYNMVVRHIGEAAIIEDAIELIGNDVYGEALGESGLAAYGMGTLEDVTFPDGPQLVFSVPLQPDIEMPDYRQTRVPYEAPVVSAEEVDSELERLRRQHAQTEDKDTPIAEGDSVVVNVHGSYEDAEDPEREVDSDDAEDDARDHVEFMHEHSLEIQLDPTKVQVVPGFREALIGAEKGQAREFTLTVPDEEQFAEGAGRNVSFHVEILEVRTVTLPELNDAFAQLVLLGESPLAEPLTDDDTVGVSEETTEAEGGVDPVMSEVEAAAQEEEETPSPGPITPPTVEALRQDVANRLQNEAEKKAQADHAERVVSEIIEGSSVRFPEAAVDDRVDDMLEEMDERFRSQGFTLDEYKKMMNKSDDDLRAEYRETAGKSLERILVIRELLQKEQVSFSDDEIIDRMRQMIAPFGGDAEMFLSIIDTPEMRTRIANDVLYENLMHRMHLIGIGEAPELASPVDDLPAEEDNGVEDEEPVPVIETVTGDQADQ